MSLNLTMERSSEEIRAEMAYLNYFWTGYFKQECYGLNFYLLKKKAREKLKKICNEESIKKMNKFLPHPQISKYLLENIIDDLWAFPDKIMDAVSMELGAEFPQESDAEAKIPADVIFDIGQLTVLKALENITDKEEGISLLSGYELRREPFDNFKFKKLYSVDMCYLDKVNRMDDEKLKNRLWQIFEESCSKPRKFLYDFKKLYENEKGGSYVKRNGLFLDSAKNNEYYLEWILRQLNKKRRKQFETGEVVPVLGNVTNLKNCKQINMKRYSTKPISFENSSLDFALLCGIDWLVGDWKKCLVEAERVLKDHAKILITGYSEIMFRLPVEGGWAPQLKDYLTYTEVDYSAIGEFLENKGFSLAIYLMPNNYTCIYGER